MKTPKLIKPLNEVMYEENFHNAKFAIYGYFVKDEVKYVGQLSDANKKDTFKRGRDIGGHNNQECSDNYDNIQVKIITYVHKKDRLSAMEAAYIKAFNLVKKGWNRREELVDTKFYDILSVIEDGEKMSIETLVKLALDGAQGADTAEPQELSEKLVSAAGINSKEVLLVGNEKYGMVHTALELQKRYKGQIDMNTTRDGILNLTVNGGLDEGTLIPSTTNFLETNFTKKYDTIIMNPPWAHIGTKFVAKAESLLKDGGTLVVITGYNGFTASSKAPGTFYDLQQKGYFEIIETFKAGGEGDYFKTSTSAKDNWVWFKFIKSDKPEGYKTHIRNRLGARFDYNLDGNETYIPQLENERDYFDYKNGIWSGACNSNQEFNMDGFAIKIMPNNKISKARVWPTKKGQINKPYKDIPNTGTVCAIMPMLEDITEGKVTELLLAHQDWIWLYANKVDRLRLPPLRKDLFAN